MGPGYEALRSQAALLDLTGRGQIAAQGEDRARLLHAITTNDVANLAAGHGLYTFFLNANGRILADSNLYNLGDVLWLDTEPEAAGFVLHHLDKYIIADDVTLDDRTGAYQVLGLEGPESLNIAAAQQLPVPAAPLAVLPYGNGFVVRIATAGTEGLRFLLPAGEAESLRAMLQAHVPLAGPSEARAVRLENKRPRFGDDITDRYLVQETQQLSAVHFSKGCYLGQEIVERVRSRGQVHRLLTPIQITGQEVPVAGAKLSVNGKEVGEITSAAYSPAMQSVVAFAYLRGEGLLPSAPLQIEVGSITQQAAIRI